MESSRITSEHVTLNSLTDQMNCLNRAWLNAFFKWLASLTYQIATKCMTHQLSGLLFWIAIQMVRLVYAIGTIVQWLERSVISKQWSVPILPLRSNNALDSITIPIENTKTQSNEFFCCLLSEKDKGLVLRTDKSRGLECFLNADWAVSWQDHSSNNKMSAQLWS